MTTKSYIKPTKMRQDATVSGQTVTILVDLTKNLAFMLMPEQEIAVKLDFSEAAAQINNPVEEVSSISSDAQLVGSEIVDGKQATVYEYRVGSASTRLWIWTERGLVLKQVTTEGGDTSLVEFTDYSFDPIPDNIFELPPGTEIVELPGMGPGVMLPW